MLIKEAQKKATQLSGLFKFLKFLILKNQGTRLWGEDAKASDGMKKS